MRIAHVAIIAIVAGALVFVLSGGIPTEGWLRVGNTEFKLLVADERAELTKGLGGRDSLGEDEAMLFMFPSEGLHGIWMKDMRFPIDIVWFDEDWKIIDVRTNVSPDTYPEVFYPKSPSRYVLEFNAGTIERYGISVGITADF